jgi:hypothetical protein
MAVSLWTRKQVFIMNCQGRCAKLGSGISGYSWATSGKKMIHMEQEEANVGLSKWAKLVWSLCIIALIWFLKARFEQPPVDEGAGVAEYLVFAALWIIGGISGMAGLAFRLLKVLRRPDHFAYIFCGVLDIAVAVAGAFNLWRSPLRGASPAEWCLLGVTAVIGLFILGDAFLTGNQR